MFKHQLNMNNSLINKSVSVLVENKIDGQNKFFGRNSYMNSVIFDGDEDCIGKVINVKIIRANQNTLFGKIENKNNKRAA